KSTGQYNAICHKVNRRSLLLCPSVLRFVYVLRLGVMGWVSRSQFKLPCLIRLGFPVLVVTLMTVMTVLVTAMFVGCGPVGKEGGGDHKFLLPWPNDRGGYDLQVITLSTLSSPYEMKGTAAQVYLQATFTSTRLHGTVAWPHLTRSGDVYVPMDAQ